MVILKSEQPYCDLCLCFITLHFYPLRIGSLSHAHLLSVPLLRSHGVYRKWRDLGSLYSTQIKLQINQVEGIF